MLLAIFYVLSLSLLMRSDISASVSSAAPLCPGSFFLSRCAVCVRWIIGGGNMGIICGCSFTEECLLLPSSSLVSFFFLASVSTVGETDSSLSLLADAPVSIFPSDAMNTSYEVSRSSSNLPFRNSLYNSFMPAILVCLGNFTL